MTTTTHVQIGLANPFLICTECRKKTLYWHDPLRCGCEESAFLYPCGHKAEPISTCATWVIGYGCLCEDGCKSP